MSDAYLRLVNGAAANSLEVSECSVSAPVDHALSREAMTSLARELEELLQQIVNDEVRSAGLIDFVHPVHRPSARNLVHYLSLRRHDLRDLQRRLARTGLSSLGRCESHVLITLERVLSVLALARGDDPPALALPPVGFREGHQILAANARAAFGSSSSSRSRAIMVTLPTAAALKPQLAHSLIAAGMDCARINCAHDYGTLWAAMAANVRAAARAQGRECRILVDLQGAKIRTGAIPGGKSRICLSSGDRFQVVRTDSRAYTRRKAKLRRISCSSEGVFRHVLPGQTIWFDDGKIGGVIEEANCDALTVRVTHAQPGGAKLRAGKGINLPETFMPQGTLTSQDLLDLRRVVKFADIICLSFAEREEDVLALQSAVQDAGAPGVGIFLKIETRRGFMNLPRLLLSAMRSRSCGIMIGRGDLAVEIGFERLAEVQEEILWIAEAAHVPAIWATQVLDTLVKKGTYSRAEVTDAAMSERAEAVLLNKGPFIIEGIQVLDDILGRMQDHQSKKLALYRALKVSREFWNSD